MNLDALQTFDKSILLAFNGGENIFLDSFVLTLTSAYTWIPLYASLLYLVIKNNENWQKIILIIGTVALGLFIVNGTNLGIVKPLIARARPLNSPDLQGIVVSVNHYVADGYSFFSSHTANAFVLAVFFSFISTRPYLFYLDDSVEYYRITNPSLSWSPLPFRCTCGYDIWIKCRCSHLFFYTFACIFGLVISYTISLRNIREQVIASQI